MCPIARQRPVWLFVIPTQARVDKRLIIPRARLPSPRSDTVAENLCPGAGQMSTVRTIVDNALPIQPLARPRRRPPHRIAVENHVTISSLAHPHGNSLIGIDASIDAVR